MKRDRTAGPYASLKVGDVVKVASLRYPEKWKRGVVVRRTPTIVFLKVDGWTNLPSEFDTCGYQRYSSFAIIGIPTAEEIAAYEARVAAEKEAREAAEKLEEARVERCEAIKRVIQPLLPGDAWCGVSGGEKHHNNGLYSIEIGGLTEAEATRLAKLFAGKEAS